MFKVLRALEELETCSMSALKAISKICQKSEAVKLFQKISSRMHRSWSLFFNKVPNLLLSCKLKIKKKNRDYLRCFLLNFAKFSRNNFFKNLQWLTSKKLIMQVFPLTLKCVYSV